MCLLINHGKSVTKVYSDRRGAICVCFNSFKPGAPFMGHRQTERGVPSGAILFA